MAVERFGHERLFIPVISFSRYDRTRGRCVRLCIGLGVGCATLRLDPLQVAHHVGFLMIWWRSIARSMKQVIRAKANLWPAIDYGGIHAYLISRKPLWMKLRVEKMILHLVAIRRVDVAWSSSLRC